MTASEVFKKYRDKYFHFVITKQVDLSGQNDLGYIAYTYDSPREMRQIPVEEFEGLLYGVYFGDALEPYGTFERIISYDKD